MNVYSDLHWNFRGGQSGDHVALVPAVLVHEVLALVVLAVSLVWRRRPHSIGL